VDCSIESRFGDHRSRVVSRNSKLLNGTINQSVRKNDFKRNSANYA